MLIVTRTRSGDKFRRVSSGPEIVLVDYTARDTDREMVVKVSCYGAESPCWAYQGIVRACQILDKPFPEFPQCRRSYTEKVNIDYEKPSWRRSWESGNCLYFYAGGA